MDNVTQEQNQDTNAEEILSNGVQSYFKIMFYGNFFNRGVYEIRFEG